MGWAKGLEFAKLARSDGQHFDCATWLHKARQMPKEDFKKEAEREWTGGGAIVEGALIPMERRSRSRFR